jgi:hypothetical protein
MHTHHPYRSGKFWARVHAACDLLPWGDLRQFSLELDTKLGSKRVKCGGSGYGALASLARSGREKIRWRRALCVQWVTHDQHQPASEECHPEMPLSSNLQAVQSIVGTSRRTDEIVFFAYLLLMPGDLKWKYWARSAALWGALLQLQNTVAAAIPREKIL